MLERGSVHVDGRGPVATTEQCLLHPSRNRSLGRQEIEAHVLEQLGAEEMPWLGQGLVGGRDTDGHVELARTRVASVRASTSRTVSSDRC